MKSLKSIIEQSIALNNGLQINNSQMRNQSSKSKFKMNYSTFMMNRIDLSQLGK